MRILFALFGAAALLGLIAALTHDNEPRYNGRSLSQWLAICRASNISQEQRQEAADAIRHIGTNAFPLLLKWASAEPSQNKPKIQSFLRHLPISVIPKRLRQWADLPPDQTRANQAKMGFLVLGPDAAPAIPELAQLAAEVPPKERTFWAISALGNIGPQALPALLTIVENPNVPSRSAAIYEIGKFGTNALPALPTIIRLLEDPQSYVKELAATALGELHICPESSIPALVQCLQNANPTLRFRAAGALIKFGDEARVAIPELRKVASEETEPIRKQYLLQSISKLATATTNNVPR